MTQDLQQLRQRIDAIDQQLLQLLNQRAAVVQQVGHLKSETNAVVYVPEREASLHRRLRENNPGPISNDGINSIFNEIVSVCRSLEARLSVGYLGPAGTYCHSAARAKFGTQCDFIPYASFPEIFEAVSRRQCQYGVVALENSNQGVVTATLDHFLETDINICAEIYWNIHHHLLAHCPLDQVRRVYSHGQAFGQCRHWLARNLPGIECIEVGSTSRGAQLAAAEPDTAAIAPRDAADIYHVPVQAACIEDRTDNITRFVVLSHDMPKPTEHDKTSLLVFVVDQPGALFRALEPFYQAGINLMHIQSRPTRRESWQYVFFIELEGHSDLPAIQQVFEQLRQRSLLVKILGAYPRESIARPKSETMAVQ